MQLKLMQKQNAGVTNTEAYVRTEVMRMQKMMLSWCDAFKNVFSKYAIMKWIFLVIQNKVI